MPRVNEGQIEIKVPEDFQERYQAKMNQIWAVNPFQGNLVGNNAAVAIRDELFELKEGIGQAPGIPHPFPLPQPPAPVKPDFVYHFQGMDLIVPSWTQYISQEPSGNITVYSEKPKKMGKIFLSQFGKSKVIVKPEPYEQIIEEIAQW